MRAGTSSSLFFCSVAVVIGSALAAQEKPDFSGKWVLEQPSPAPTKVAEELDVRQWTEEGISPISGQWYAFDHITIEQRFAGDEVHTYRYQIGLGGGIVGGVDANGRGRGPNGQLPHTKFSTRWEGSRLGIDTGVYSGNSPEAGPYSEISEVWSLDADTLVIARTTRSSTSEPTTITLSYSRR